MLLRILTGPEHHNIILKVSMIRSKITWYTKNQENPNNFQGKRQQKPNYKMVQMFKLSYFKAAMITMK